MPSYRPKEGSTLGIKASGANAHHQGFLAKTPRVNRSLNFEKRRRELKKIDEENIAMLERIANPKISSSVNFDNQVGFYER